MGIASAGCTHDAPPPPMSTPPAGSERAAALPDGDPTLAKQLVADGALLLDVRTKSEFDERHLDGAVLVPVQELSRRMAEIDTLTGGDHDKPIVVYCRSGHRAGQAKQMLLSAGYRKVTNLGGIDDWPTE